MSRAVFFLQKIKIRRSESIMFDLKNLEHLAENEAADRKIEKLRARQEETKREIEKAEREIEQGENKIKRLTQSLSKQTRSARTRRLIERGAILEAFIPEAENLTGDEIKTILAKVFRAGS
jgi:predicted ribosome quality control (RQC) complex YloA/Tae2 family protein